MALGRGGWQVVSGAPIWPQCQCSALGHLQRLLERKPVRSWKSPCAQCCTLRAVSPEKHLQHLKRMQTMHNTKPPNGPLYIPSSCKLGVVSFWHPLMFIRYLSNVSINKHKKHKEAKPLNIFCCLFGKSETNI